MLSLLIRKNASIENLIQTATDTQNKTLADALIELKTHLIQEPSAAISVAVAISNYNESSRLHESNLKFRIARQLSPALTARVDSIYYEDPERAKLETQKREARDLSVKGVEELLKNKQNETREAGELLKKLKRQ